MKFNTCYNSTEFRQGWQIIFVPQIEFNWLILFYIFSKEFWKKSVKLSALPSVQTLTEIPKLTNSFSNHCDHDFNDEIAYAILIDGRYFSSILHANCINNLLSQLFIFILKSPLSLQDKCIIVPKQTYVSEQYQNSVRHWVWFIDPGVSLFYDLLGSSRTCSLVRSVICSRTLHIMVHPL